MSTEKTIDISVLPEAEQDLIKALFDKCCERANKKKEKNQSLKFGNPNTENGIGLSALMDKSVIVNGQMIA
ncbi:hypothetical protein [Anaerostipes sp. Marseille-Q3525]|uniref:hypothetical protein n=1 Tax=Anaerostipes sp. Marseille-Q3525 TaxID=2758418 RepID=UPI001BAE0F40|nr:hypothetical protein [Anaerostipes sp. Marseille-Q3525]MBR9961881.1 hypothetical protein [Anaerostipes sp. Marseille-Q3525]